MIISIYNTLIKQLFSIFGKRAFAILSLLFCTTFTLTAYSQTTVQGKVIDELGKPVQAASVAVKGTSRGTITNENGLFTISASPENILVISSVGFANKEIKVGNETNFTISLTLTNSQLEQVIVVGYGTQKRTAVTGAISTVNNKTLNEIPVVSVQEALQGRVPGLSVVNNGSPGTSPIVTIRGISSITYASNPLYIVDGFPTGDLSTIDTRDIESVDVLKDASAAAIYGSRATNGVIMITTKKGKRDGKLHVSLNSYYGIQDVTERLSLLNPEQFDQYATAYRGSKVSRRTDPAWVNTPIYQGASATYGNNVTDWQDEYFRQGSMTQTNIGVSGGNDVSRFYASAGFFDQTGVAPAVGFRRYNFRINSEHTISKTFSFGENLYIAHGDQDYDNNETGSRSNLLNVIRIMPYMPVHDPTTQGGYRGVNSVLDGGDPTNPIEDAELKNPGNRTTVKVLGTVFAEVNFTSWLKFRSTFGVDYANTLDYRFSPIFNDSGTIAGSSAIQATITNNRSISTVQLYTEQLTFDKTFGNHHVNAIAVYEYQGQRTKNENASGNQASNDLKTLNNASNVSVQTLVGDLNIISYIGRVTYDYKGKYLLNAAIRRDGGSYWAPGNKWQTFPSGSIGWRIDQENFMKDQKTISELKVRAGYGITGLNGAVLGATPWSASVSANSAYYPFGNVISSGPASSIQRLGNKDLEWETTKQLNIGLDLGLLNNAITLSAEYYQRKTDNLILAVPLPPSMGYITSSVITNAGAMKNDGFEFQLGYNDREGDFTWNATGNLSIITNKVLELAPGVSNIEAGSDQDFTEGYNPTNTAPGQPIQSFYGWEMEGIFQSADEVAKSPFQTAGTGAGDIKFRDIDGNDTINLNDRTFLGSFIPDFSYSLNLSANYKNFGLTLFFQGVQGNKIYNATRTATEGMIRFFNAGTQVLDAWTPDHTNTNVPRAISSDPNQNARPSTRFLEDGSYLRLKNIMLSYNVPGKSLQSLTKGTVKNLNIYISAQNILTFTNYSGFDPEVGNRTVNTSALTNGIDYAVYPQPKGYQVGINVNFKKKRNKVKTFIKPNIMKRNISLLVIAVILATAVMIACNKKLDVTDQNNPTTESYFKTAAELQNGVNAVYSSLRAGNLVGREWFFTHDMRGAETWAGGSQLEAPRAELLKQPSPAPSNAVMTSVWTGTYQMINRANLVISKAPDVTDNIALRDITVGEAEFLRAWAYFELVTMWGDVPLYTEPITSASGYKGKSPAADIYSQIISDLTDAASKLPDVQSQQGRATKGAAYALLGKAQLQNGSYDAAKEALLKVYGKYSLVPYLFNFDGDAQLGSSKIATGHEFNAESIFEVAFVDKGDNNFNWGYTGEGATANVSIMRSQEYGIVWGNVIPSDQVLNEFEPNDPRYKYTFYESGDNIMTMGGTVPGKALTEDGMNVAQSNHNGVVKKRVFRKYSILDWTDDGFHPDGINQRMIRYADVLLMLAECEAETGTPADAAKYINEVRARPDVNMPPVSPTTKDQAIAAVMHERSVELAGEEVNNIDILRWRAKGYYPAIRPDPKPGQVDLFPIPASEIAANPLLK